MKYRSAPNRYPTAKYMDSRTADISCAIMIEARPRLAFDYRLFNLGHFNCAGKYVY